MTTTSTTPLISSAVAAEQFGVDRATFNRWAADGKVPTAMQLDGKRGARLFERTVIAELVRHYTEHGALPVEDDGAPCCPDPECSGNPCTFGGYADNH